MEQDDEEIEQLLGEIPRATSAPPHLAEFQRAEDTLGEDSFSEREVDPFDSIRGEELYKLCRAFPDSQLPATIKGRRVYADHILSPKSAPDEPQSFYSGLPLDNRSSPPCATLEKMRQLEMQNKQQDEGLEQEDLMNPSPDHNSSGNAQYSYQDSSSIASGFGSLNLGNESPNPGSSFREIRSSNGLANNTMGGMVRDNPLYLDGYTGSPGFESDLGTGSISKVSSPLRDVGTNTHSVEKALGRGTYLGRKSSSLDDFLTGGSYYQNQHLDMNAEAGHLPTTRLSSSLSSGSDLYLASFQRDYEMASISQAQKAQQAFLLQLQLEEERQRRQRFQHQYLLQQQLQERQAAQLYGLQSQALLAAAVAPMPLTPSFRTGRQFALHPSLALGGQQQGWIEPNTQSHLESLYAASQPGSLCRYYAQGYCSRGDLCPFLHAQIPGTARNSASKDSRSILANHVEKCQAFPERILRRNSRHASATSVSRKKPDSETNGHAYTNGNHLFSPGNGGSFHLDVRQARAAMQESYQFDVQRQLTSSQNQPQPKYTSLKEVEGRIYSIAKDQHGCRFLQRKFDEGSPEDLQKIFVEIIDQIVELMTDPFGNYLVQKLLEVCNEAQRLEILRVVTSGEELVTISLNMHGTRAVQKLIETLKSPEQVSMIISSLKHGVVTLIKDLNGNHVVQRCLQRLSSEDSQFIFDAAAQHCVDIATHRHGCCVLQRCVDFAKGLQKERLVAEIAANALVLSQDQYGNYVVQYILDEMAWASPEVMARLEGNYALLGMQKFSSNVVEKCLKQAGDENRARIVHELISSSLLGQLLQDPFANYVIQCALTVTKGALHANLVEAIRPHLPALRSSPYGKRILSRTNLKK